MSDYFVFLSAVIIFALFYGFFCFNVWKSASLNIPNYGICLAGPVKVNMMYIFLETQQGFRLAACLRP
ncbi:MAG: hypothetical protein R2865_15550 [Deinococcales bacterium]